MTHEEEEVQHDISKLRDQVKQIFLSQRVNKNEMKANMDDQVAEYHIEHQRQVLLLLKDNLTLA